MHSSDYACCEAKGIKHKHAQPPFPAPPPRQLAFGADAATLLPPMEYLSLKRELTSVSTKGSAVMRRASAMLSPVSGRVSTTLSVCSPLLKRGSALLQVGGTGRKWMMTGC